MSENIFSLEETPLVGAFIIKLTRYSDNRGYLCEIWNENIFKTLGINTKFVQDKISWSKKGVLRGLHLQVKHSQAKLVAVLKGKVYDVIVDLRPSSKTFGKWFGIELSDQNDKILYIPRGFAHGFLALEDTIFFYKTSDQFFPEYDTGIIWNDETLNIDWPLSDIDSLIISPRDSKLYKFKDFVNKFGGDLDYE